MNFKIIMMNLIVPILAVLVIEAITGGFRAKKKESINSEVYEYFVKIWKADEKEDEKDSFFQRFLRYSFRHTSTKNTRSLPTSSNTISTSCWSCLCY